MTRNGTIEATRTVTEFCGPVRKRARHDHFFRVFEGKVCPARLAHAHVLHRLRPMSGTSPTIFAAQKVHLDRHLAPANGHLAVEDEWLAALDVAPGLQ